MDDDSMGANILDNNCEELELDLELLPFEVSLLESRRVRRPTSDAPPAAARALTLRDATSVGNGHTQFPTTTATSAKLRDKRWSRDEFQLGSDAIEQFEFVIDRLGEESAKAQGLRAPITTLARFIDASCVGPDLSQRIYMLAMPPHDNR